MPSVTGIAYASISVPNPEPLIGGLAALGFTTHGSITGPGEDIHLMGRDGAHAHIISPRGPGNGSGLDLYGPGVRDLAFITSDVPALYDRARHAGARDIQYPRCGPDGIWTAIVGGCGHALAHTLTSAWPHPVSHAWWDHAALAVPTGGTDKAAAFYADGFGFRYQPEDRVRAGAETLEHGVLRAGQATLTVISQHDGPPGQVTRFITSNGHQPGVHHLGLHVDRISREVHAASAAGVPFPGGITGDTDQDGPGGTTREVRQILTGPLLPGSQFRVALISRNGLPGFPRAGIAALYAGGT